MDIIMSLRSFRNHLAKVFQDLLQDKPEEPMVKIEIPVSMTINM
jgi:hypothetical protein